MTEETTRRSLVWDAIYRPWIAGVNVLGLPPPPEDPEDDGRDEEKRRRGEA